MSTDPNVLFGHREEWRAFEQRHPVFLERLPRLMTTLNLAFIRSIGSPGKLDTMLFFTSRQCVDDFLEILLLCGNGEGHGSQKLLRTLFERVVLVKYLHAHPEKIDDYYDYYHVSVHKLIETAIRTWGADAIDAEAVTEARANYERVREKYRIRECRSCGRKEMGPAWSPMALADMAEEVGLGKFVLYAYSLPLLHAHPSAKGTLDRLEGTREDLTISYGERVDRSLADRVLATAHALILQVLIVQAERFKADELTGANGQLDEDYGHIWNRGVLGGAAAPQ